MSSIDAKWQNLVDTFLRYNAQINLSAIRDPEGVYVKHILDSLELLKIVDFETGKLGVTHKNKEEWQGSIEALKHWSNVAQKRLKIADIGTGGWFPLLPLAISYPDVLFVGIDSVRKKLQAIESICKELEIANVELERARIEDMREKFDIVTARAVAHVEKLIPWVHGLLKSGSKLILYKEVKQEEKEAMVKLLWIYKLKLIQEHTYILFEGDIQRVIYVIEKSK